MEKANIVDMLLHADARKITDMPMEKMEIKRLSDLLGGKFEITVRGIGAERYTEIQQAGINLNKKAEFSGLDTYKMSVLTLMEGIVEPDLKNKQLLQHFGAITPKDLIGKLFRAGEIADISRKIQELSGYEADQDEVNEEVKN